MRMWRPTKLIARRAFIGRHNASAAFLEIQSFSKVLQSQSSASAEPQFIRHSSLYFTAPFCRMPRFFSSNPSSENEELNKSRNSVDSKPGFDENSSVSFSDSVLSEANNANRDGNGLIVDSEFGFDESSSSFSFEFEEGNQNSDDLSFINDGVASTSDGEGLEVITGENNGESMENLLSLLQSSGTVDSLESSLEDLGLILNEDLVMKVLETPFVPAENLIGFFKWNLKKREFFLSTKVIDLLVKAVSHEIRIRDAYALWNLFKLIGEKEIIVLSTDILNQLICLLSKLCKGKAAFEVFSKFEDFDCLPDSDTYYLTIDALSRRSIFDLASSVCDKMLIAEKLPDAEKIGKIISHLCRGKKLKDAHNIYIWAKENNKYPPQSAVNFLINSLCGKEKPEKENKKTREDRTVSYSHVEEVVSPEEKENIYLALKMLDDLPASERKYATKSFSVVTSGLCRIKDIQAAKDLLFKMIEAGPPPGYTIFNTIITAYSRAGDMEEAMKLIQTMGSRGLKPDVYTYAVVMGGYVEGGAMEDAHKILDEAKRKHLKLSPIIYYTLIQGYSKLEQFDMAWKLLREMKEYAVQPSANEYKKLIKSLCFKSLDWATAEQLLQEMQEKGLHLNELTKSLIKAVKELEEEALASEVVTAAA
ncbi:hypothetical protein M9H77_18494 [Catharanthus roseus]|uniref:Uncharacterized protein n=1 Tax=Catharanthus roseus TaxID=4058 RepID=A0ACC0B7L4_CATRO|nr:hypothetical protein M9H77_18494 [Catharanthus roseus]